MAPSLDTSPRSPAPTSALAEAFNADLARANAAVAPHLITIDGEQFIDVTAPESLRRYYTNLVSVGYANGFID